MSEDLTFAAAVRAAESGNPEGNYQQVKGRVRNTRLLGAYGIPGDEWKQMAADVGLEGARWNDPRAQDAVAKRMFDLLYQKYGDWRLVAVAWKAGEEVADRVAQDPSLLKRKELAPLKDYVSQVMQRAREDIEVNEPMMPDGSPVDSARFQPTMRGMEPTQGSTRSPEDALRGILKGMRERVRNQNVAARAAEPSEELENAPAKEGVMDRLTGRGDNG